MSSLFVASCTLRQDPSCHCQKTLCAAVDEFWTGSRHPVDCSHRPIKLFLHVHGVFCKALCSDLRSFCALPACCAAPGQHACLHSKSHSVRCVDNADLQHATDHSPGISLNSRFPMGGNFLMDESDSGSADEEEVCRALRSFVTLSSQHIGQQMQSTSKIVCQAHGIPDSQKVIA